MQACKQKRTLADLPTSNQIPSNTKKYQEGTLTAVMSLQYCDYVYDFLV